MRTENMAKKEIIKNKKALKVVKEKPPVKMNEEMKKLLQKKTADAYVDFAVKSELTPAEKRFVTRQWLEKTGFTIDDINYARNRHPYWKKIKMKGAAERTRARMQKYDFSKGIHKKWGKEELLEFLEINGQFADFELAEKFQCSIPAIQGVRRLYNLAGRILESEGKKKVKSALHKLMMINEKALRNMYREKNPVKKGARKK